MDLGLGEEAERHRDVARAAGHEHGNSGLLEPSALVALAVHRGHQRREHSEHRQLSAVGVARQCQIERVARAGERVGEVVGRMRDEHRELVVADAGSSGVDVRVTDPRVVDTGDSNALTTARQGRVLIHEQRDAGIGHALVGVAHAFPVVVVAEYREDAERSSDAPDLRVERLDPA